MEPCRNLQNANTHTHLHLKQQSTWTVHQVHQEPNLYFCSYNFPPSSSYLPSTNSQQLTRILPMSISKSKHESFFHGKVHISCNFHILIINVYITLLPLLPVSYIFFNVSLTMLLNVVTFTTNFS